MADHKGAYPRISITYLETLPGGAVLGQLNIEAISQTGSGFRSYDAMDAIATALNAGHHNFRVGYNYTVGPRDSTTSGKNIERMGCSIELPASSMTTDSNGRLVVNLGLLSPIHDVIHRVVSEHLPRQINGREKTWHDFGVYDP